MRVLAAVVEGATLAMLYSWQYLTLRCTVALELLRDDHPWHVLQALEQLAKELLGGVLVAATLHQDVEHVIVLIHGAPQVMALPVHCQKHLVQVPFVAWLGTSM